MTKRICILDQEPGASEYAGKKGEVMMEFPEGKYAWMVKIGEKGQFVIPKEAREIFDIKPGDSVLVLADLERGIAIPTKETRNKHFSKLFEELE